MFLKPAFRRARKSPDELEAYASNLNSNFKSCARRFAIIVEKNISDVLTSLQFVTRQVREANGTPRVSVARINPHLAERAAFIPGTGTDTPAGEDAPYGGALRARGKEKRRNRRWRWPRRVESNHQLTLRRGRLYPFNYGETMWDLAAARATGAMPAH